MQDGAAQRQTGDEGQAVIDELRDLLGIDMEVAQDRRRDQRQHRRRQPVTGLGVMGDAVQRLVGAGVDMVVDEMRQRPIDDQRQKPDDNGKKARPQQHGG